MKKILILIISILILIQSLFTLSSCKMTKTDNNDKIQLWHYHSERDEYYPDKIIELAKQFCEVNNIPLEINIVDENSVSEEDYILKRNLAANSGNMIIIDDARYLQSIAKQHTDYTKLDSYNNLLNAYKDRYCIPLGIQYIMFYIDNDIMKHYNIDYSEKLVITYSEYLKIKQDIKEKGANFTFNIREYYEIIHYYLNLNKLLFADIENEISNNSNRLKEMLKKSILDICNEFKIYDYSKLDVNDKLVVRQYKEIPIYDEKSELYLGEDFKFFRGGLMDPYRYGDILNGVEISDKTFVIYPHLIVSSPCFYMYKKVTNDKIYDLANFIVSESSYFAIKNQSKYLWFAPVFDTENTKKALYLNDDWEFIGNENYTKVTPMYKKLADATFEILAKNEEKSKEIADYYFYYNEDNENGIISFIKTTIDDIAQKLSSNQMSLEKFNSNSEEINKLIDDKIDEFVYNFRIHNE